MAKEIKFSIKLNIDGKEQFGTVTANAKELVRTLDGAKTSAARFQDVMVKFASISSIIKNTGEAVGVLAGKLNELNSKNLSMQQQTGLTGEAMAELRNEVQAVATTYGKEFSEVLTGVSTMMKGFGISSEEAMRLVRSGLMSGADATGQMFDILKEYPTYFKEAGLTAEQFMAIITNGANMGVFNDKAADTIKEGNLRLREMTKATAEALDGIGLDSTKIQDQLKSGMLTTFDVMQQVGAKLKELPQTSAEVGTAIADIFGGPGEDAGLAYIESLADMELGMNKLKSQASDTGKALDGQVDGLKNINDVLMAVVDKFNVLPSLQPFLNITSQIGMTVIGVESLVSSLKALNIVETATALRTKGIAVAMSAYRATQIATNAIVAASAGHFKTAAVGATTLKVAIRGLLVATGVGAALTALGLVIDYLYSSSDKATDEMDTLKDAHDAFTSSAANVQTELDKETKKLGELIKAKKDTSEAVANLNEKYGEIFGSHQKASDWYDILTKKSKIYARQVGYEAEAKVLATRMAEAQIKMEENFAKRRALWESGGAQTKKTGIHVDENGNTSSFSYMADSDELKQLKEEARPLVAEYKKLSSEFEIVNRLSSTNAQLLGKVGGKIGDTSKEINITKANYKDLGDEMEKVWKKLSTADPGSAQYKKLSAYYKRLKAQKDAIEKETGKSSSKSTTKEPKFYKDPKTEAQLSKNINYYKGKLTGDDTDEERKLIASIKKWEDMKEAIELKNKAAAVPTEIKNLDDIAVKLDYLSAKRKRASQEDIAAIDSEIAELETLQKNFANKSVIDMPDSAVQSYEQLNIKLQYYNDLMDKATTNADRSKWQGHIDTLNDIQEVWEKVRNSAAKAKEYENLSIKPIVETETKDIVKGSDDDKRASYNNASSRASRIQSDLDMGIIVDKTKAQEQLDAINEELKKLNLQPIKIEFETNADKVAKEMQNAISALSNIDLTNMDNVKTAFENIKSITDPTTQGFAAAGAACSALGGAMQQLGTDSEAAKAGMVMAAIGEIVLSFAEALRSAKTWVEWLAFGISGAAMMTTLISQISGFKDGGIVGGNSKSGDKLIARVNSGEMILNTQQQQRLWNIVNGSTGYQSMAGAAAQNIGGNFRMTVSGRNLVGVLANETRVSSKSGKRTNIVI